MFEDDRKVVKYAMRNGTSHAITHNQVLPEPELSSFMGTDTSSSEGLAKKSVM